MPEGITELDQKKSKLLNKGDLTNKQAAILAAFEQSPGASYADIAERATDLLPEGEGVTGSYAGEQIKERRPGWFDDAGNRRPPEEMQSGEDEVDEEVRRLARGDEVEMDVSDEAEEVEIDDDRVATLADWYNVSESQARAMAYAEATEDVEFTGREGVEEAEEQIEEAEGIAVRMNENSWLRLIAFLHLFADTDEGEKHEERAMKIAGEITNQAL